MEKAILGIVVLVAIVGVVGLLSSYDFGATDALDNGLTGNVIAEPGAVQTQDCASCAGYAPVCAKVNNRFITYPNACAAECDGASIAVYSSCEAAPRV